MVTSMKRRNDAKTNAMQQMALLAKKRRDSISAIRRETVRRSRIDDIKERGEKMSQEEVAAELGIAVSSVRTLASIGEIPAYKLFRRLIFFRNEVEMLKGYMMKPNN